MKCIIVDDEPLAREAIELLVEEYGGLTLVGKFNSAESAGRYMAENPVDLVFLDIRMPKVTGLEFARTIPKSTLVIFTTAYAEYALESYEVDAVGYLVKPVREDKFRRAVDKAVSYHGLLAGESSEEETAKEAEFPGNGACPEPTATPEFSGSGKEANPREEEFFFVKSDRRYFKVNFADILFIEGLKDYVIIQTDQRKIITKMTVKAVSELLPGNFTRVNRSYVVNTDRIESFDTNDIYIGKHEIAIGVSYREAFFEGFMRRKKNR